MPPKKEMGSATARSKIDFVSLPLPPDAAQTHLLEMGCLFVVRFVVRLGWLERENFENDGVINN